jgi:DNA-binding NarL/FixJ family response regulator
MTETRALPVRLGDVEMAILIALSHGLQSKEIAHELQRSVATIEAHIRLLCAKLNTRTRTHLVANAYRARILVAEDSF